MNNIERGVGKVERMNVGGDKRDICRVASFGLGAGQIQGLLSDFDGGHRPRHYAGSEVDGDRPWAATDIEHGQARPQVCQQVAGGILRRASPVTA
jgi:hypothetical protein